MARWLLASALVCGAGVACGDNPLEPTPPANATVPADPAVAMLDLSGGAAVLGDSLVTELAAALIDGSIAFELFALRDALAAPTPPGELANVRRRFAGLDAQLTREASSGDAVPRAALVLFVRTAHEAVERLSNVQRRND